MQRVKVRKIFICLITFLLIGITISVIGIQNVPWPKFQHDEKNSGLSSYGASSDSGSIKWSFNTSGTIAFSSPAIDKNGTIYIGSEFYQDNIFDGYLFAIWPNGTEKWRYDVDDGIPSSPAIAPDGTIYVGSDNHSILFAFYPNGTLKWSLNLPFPGWIYPGSPTIDDSGTIYIHTWGYNYSSKNHNKIVNPREEAIVSNNTRKLERRQDVFISRLFAVNHDGTIKWSFDTEGEGECTPAITDEGTIIVGGWATVFALEPDGEQIWRYDTVNPNARLASSPAIDENGTIYIGYSDLHTGQGELLALYANGTLKWKYNTGNVFSTPSIVSNGIIYVGSTNGIFYAFYPNGQLKWTFNTIGFIFGSPLIDHKGTIYITCRSDPYDKLYAIYPSGIEKWNINISDYDIGCDFIGLSPSIDSMGTIYIHGFYNDFSTLLAIGEEDIIPPDISNVDANPDLQLSNQSVNISSFVSDNVGLDNVFLNIIYPNSTSENFSIFQNKTEQVFYCNKTYHQSGIYTYRIWAYDTSGNQAQSLTYEFKIIPEESVIPLSTEWNFISLLLNESINKTSFVIRYNGSLFNWTQAITENNPTGEPIINDCFFNWNRQDQYYTFNKLIEPGYGYWLYSFEDCEILIESITPVYDDYITTIEPNWNLVSVPYNQPVHKMDILVCGVDWDIAVGNGWVSNFVFGWNRAGQSYEFADTFTPGQAYWLYSYQQCVLKREV